MTIRDEVMMRRRRFEVAVIVGGWATIAASVFLVNSIARAKPSTLLWAASTLGVLAVTAALISMIVIDAARARRDAAARIDVKFHLSGLTLGAIAWFLGGLFEVVFYFALLHSDFCGGTGGLGSFECVNRPGLVLDTLGVVSAVAATPVMAVLYKIGRHSRVAAWLSPVVIVSLYLLALCLWEPHVGFGVVGVDRTLGFDPVT